MPRGTPVMCSSRNFGNASRQIQTLIFSDSSGPWNIDWYLTEDDSRVHSKFLSIHLSLRVLDSVSSYWNPSILAFYGGILYYWKIIYISSHSSCIVNRPDGALLHVSTAIIAVLKVNDYVLQHDTNFRWKWGPMYWQAQAEWSRGPQRGSGLAFWLFPPIIPYVH